MALTLVHSNDPVVQVIISLFGLMFFFLPLLLFVDGRENKQRNETLCTIPASELVWVWVGGVPGSRFHVLAGRRLPSKHAHSAVEKVKAMPESQNL